MRARRLAQGYVVGFALLLGLAGACGHSAEGESCDLENGNTDCEDGLICRSGYEVKAGKSVCCPRPPTKPSTSACETKHEGYEPDPSVDAAPIPPGTGGTGGNEAGSDATSEAEAGAAGAAGSDAASDGPSDAATDTPADTSTD